MRLAAVDVGSNTVHSLVADVLDDGTLRDVSHYVEMPELGAAVARSGNIGPGKSRIAIAALGRVVERARGDGFERLVAGATAAVRKAADRKEFLERASRAIGVPVHLIAEPLEAELSFRGAAMRHAAPAEWLLADLGGASVELVVGRAREMRGLAVLELGSGTFADRYLSDPPIDGERARLREAALDAMRAAPECEAERLVVTGGTASNLPLVLSRRNPPTVLDQAALLTAERRLDLEPAAAAARRYGVSKERVRALRGGVEILLLLADRYGVDSLHVSHEGLRHGMLLAYLERGEAWFRSAR
jgi:exopolyphosphatase/guanosine-5'-triphosphate,3'-diphosphate pyrophosphatase